MQARLSRPPLVDRDVEMTALRAVFSGALQRTGGTIVLTGESGMGKSRLLEAALEQAREDGFLTAATANFEHARAPFGPVSDVLRAVLTAAEFGLPAPASDRATLLRLVAEAGDDRSDATFDKRRAFVLVAESLTRIAQRKPWLIAVDDVQWSDPESLELMQYLVPKLIALRGVLLLANRAGDASDEATSFLGSLERAPGVTWVPVGPLPDDASRALIAASLHPGQRLSQRTVSNICERADGNALFIGVLTREALMPESPQGSATIERAVITKLQRLAAAELRVVECAAVLGRRFTLSDLEAIARRPAEEVVAALRSARDAGIIDEGDGGDGSFLFRHELIRAAVYASLLAEERRALHRRCAELIRDRPGADAALLARHWLRSGELQAAAHFAERAGDEAVLLNAHASARDRYLEAIETGTLQPADLARLNEKLARAYDVLGDSAEGATRIASAIAFHREHGDAIAAGRLALLFANMSHRAGDVDGALQACRAIAEDPALPADLCFGAHAIAALSYVLRGEPAEAARAIDAAEACATDGSISDRLSLEWARAAVARAAADEGWIVPARRAVELASLGKDPSLHAHTLLNFSILAREFGHDAEADEALTQMIAISERHGLVLASAYGRCEQAEIAYLRGNLKEARSLLLHVAALHVQALALRGWMAEIALPLLADIGRLDELPILVADGIVETVVRAHDDTRYARLVAANAYVALARGEPPDAAAVKRALSKLHSPSYVAQALIVFALCGDAEDRQRVEALLGAASPARGLRAQRLLTQAILAHRNGEGGARSALGDAHDAAERAGAPLLAALALELLGRRDEAAAIYKRCGAIARAARLRAAASTDLTGREREVAELVVAGMSNRAIATRLALSERTVENHVAAIFTKRGVRRRAELIALESGTFGHLQA